MFRNSCAACDCPLDDDIRTVTLGGRAVEVCCEACAVALKEADIAIGEDRSRADGGER